MRWASWKGLLCFTFLTLLIVVTAVAALSRWAWEFLWWLPLASWVWGVALLILGRFLEKDEGSNLDGPRTPMLILYTIVLGVFQPVMLVGGGLAGYHDQRILVVLAGALFVVIFLGPLAWVGVTSMSKGEWLQPCGAWVVLFGQFFALMFNVTTDSAGIGVWSGWIS